MRGTVRKRLTPLPKGHYSAPSPKQIINVQERQPRLYPRKAVLNAPGFALYPVPAPAAGVVRSIQEGKIPGMSVDRTGIIRTFVPLQPDEIVSTVAALHEESRMTTTTHFMKGKSDTVPRLVKNC